jgi:hypothetical protein
MDIIDEVAPSYVPDWKDPFGPLGPVPEELLDEGRAALREVFGQVRAGEPIDLAAVVSFAERLVVDMVRAEPFLVGGRWPIHRQSLYWHLFRTEPDVDFPTDHSINVAILTVRLGLALDFRQLQAVELAQAALLHDVGLCRVHPDIIHKASPLTEDDRAAIRKHSELGEEALAALPEQHRWLAEVVRQVHERENGRGYPDRLSGDAIHPYAKIVGLADVYEATSQPHANRQAVIPYEIMQELTDNREGLFAADLLEALSRTLTTYPPGSLVRLSTQELARVVAVSDESPLRPVVEVLCDESGRCPSEQTVYNLKEHPEIGITQCLSPDWVTEVMADPPAGY